MGLSSSKSKTTTNQTQTGSETTSGTQMPLTPQFLSDAAMDYVGRIGAFGDMDPNAFVAPASPLQQMAWQNAGALSGWQGQARTAAELAQKAGNVGPQVASPPTPATAFTYAAPALPAPALVSGQGYAAPQLAPGQGYAAARLGAPIGANVSGYNATTVAAPTIAATPDAAATGAQAASLLDNLSAYQSPYTRQVVDAALSEYDNGVARQQAQLAAQGARTGAFGGSRFGIAEGELAADAARGRSALAANLYDQGFRTAAGLSGQDAQARQAASLFDAGNATQVGLANAQAAAQRALAQAELAQQSGLANQAATGRAGEFNAAAANAAAQRYADTANQYSQRRALVGRFVPDFDEQGGTVDLTLTVRDRPMSSATTKGPYSIRTTDTKTDFRVSGKIMTVKYSISSDVRFRLGKPLFDIVPLGER